MKRERDLPLITGRTLLFPTEQPPKQAWLETLDTVEDEKVGLVDLHPQIFGSNPRCVLFLVLLSTVARLQGLAFINSATRRVSASSCITYIAYVQCIRV